MNAIAKFEAKLFCYQNIKVTLINITDSNNNLVSFVSAMSCGLFTSLITHPLEVIRTKQSTDTNKHKRYKGISKYI